MAAIVASIVTIAIVWFALRPWPVIDPTQRAEVIARLSAASGLAVEAAGSMEVRLTPLPEIRIAGLTMTGLSDAVAIDAAGFEGRLDVFGLLGGAVNVLTATLVSPTIVVKLDRLMPLLSAITTAPGTEASPSGAGLEPFRSFQANRISLRSAVVRVMSDDSRRDMLLSDASASWSWPDDMAAATLQGTATWRGVAVSIDAEYEPPARRPSGAQAAVSLRSPALDLGFNGLLSLRPFELSGRVSASTRDLPLFLRTIGTPASQLAAIRTAKISGDASSTADTLSLSNVSLGLDDMSFDGALAVHTQAGRPGLAGTLATETIDLAPFLLALPAPQNASGEWSDAPLSTRSVANDDIDLRISASHALVGGLRFEDGSLSLQSGNGRMELSLGEAHAYDGLLKGRLVATVDRETTDVHADLSVSRFDLKKLTRDLLNVGTLAGTATGHISLDGRGRSPAEIVAALDGRGQVSIRDGAILPPAAAWIGIPAGRDMPVMASPLTSTSFESAAADFNIAQGAATLARSWVLWPHARALVTGTASVQRQDLDLRARLEAIDDDRPDEGSLEAAGSVILSGPWRHLQLAPAAGSRLTGNDLEGGTGGTDRATARAGRDKAPW